MIRFLVICCVCYGAWVFADNFDFFHKVLFSVGNFQLTWRSVFCLVVGMLTSHVID